MKWGVRLVVLAALALGACSSGGPAAAPAPTTTTPNSTLDAALLTQSQLRRVPGLSTALVFRSLRPSQFEEDDPRGPCGGSVPKLSLDEAEGATWRAGTTGGVQLVVRASADALRRYVAARIADTNPNCPPYQALNQAGVAQQMRFTQAINVTRDVDQSLAVVVMARVNDTVRAETTIEVRLNDVLSRMVVFSPQELPAESVRGIASLMAKALEPIA